MTMKSLRTDDIIGAMPRVRHLPKSIIRQKQNYPYESLNQTDMRNSKDFQSYYANQNGKWDKSYNTNIYQNYPLSQYDPNPFIKQRPLKRDRSEQLGDSYDNQNMQRNAYLNASHQKFSDSGKLNSQRYNKANQNNYEISNDNNYNKANNNDNQYRSYNPQHPVSPRHIQQKQALFTSYDQIKQMEEMKSKMEMRQGSRERITSPRNSNTEHLPRLQPKLQSHVLDYNIPVADRVKSPNLNADKKKQVTFIQRNPSAQSRTSSLNKKEQKNIFRGLGFNIITNSKYQFNLETSKRPDPYQ